MLICIVSSMLLSYIPWRASVKMKGLVSFKCPLSLKSLFLSCHSLCHVFILFPHSVEPMTSPLGVHLKATHFYILNAEIISIRIIFCCVCLCVDASRCFPGQLGTGRSSGWESSGSGPERRQDTGSCLGRPRVGAFQVCVIAPSASYWNSF